MAKRILEIEGRLAGPDTGLNLGPDLFSAIEPASTSARVNWDSQFTGTGNNNSFLLTTECWVYVVTAGSAVVYRNLNSGSGVQDQINIVGNGSINWLFDIGGNFGPAHFDVILPASTYPRNQWVHVLHSSDMTSASLGSRIFEHTINGVLVPASSRTTNTLNNNQNGFGDPHAFSHSTFFLQSGMAGARYYMNQDFIDLTDSANVAKFINLTDFTPMQLGPDGSDPLGSVPIIFQQNSVSDILLNLGSERDADSVTSTWQDSGHNPTSPARFAHGTSASPNNAGLERTGATLGLADTQQFSMSMWFKTPLTVAAGTLVRASDNATSNRLVVDYDTAGLLHVIARNAAGTTILEATATLDDLSDNVWHSVLVSINMQAAVGSDSVRMFVDNVDTAPSVSTFVGSGSINLGQTGLDFGILNLASVGTLTQGEFSQFWCAPTVFVDFGVAATRAKFATFTSTPIPVDLGSDGSTPLGTAPLIYTGEGPTFVETAPLLNANKGSAGGTFTVSRGPWVFPTDNPASVYL